MNKGGTERQGWWFIYLCNYFFLLLLSSITLYILFNLFVFVDLYALFSYISLLTIGGGIK